MKPAFFFKSLTILSSLTSIFVLPIYANNPDYYGSAIVKPQGPHTYPGGFYLLTKGLVPGGGAPKVIAGPFTWQYFTVNQHCAPNYSPTLSMAIASIGHPDPTIKNADCPHSPKGFITSPITDAYVVPGSVTSRGTTSYQVSYAAYASYICTDENDVPKIDMTGAYMEVQYELWCEGFSVS